ncbi:hypothetical protein CEXT_145131 [Caerostris extrusa]|uniref:Uncharacterized protein n=1 Tax=Caerostris extrusa TaxID=172846 RepID=A0AAV4PUD4_CAEEX|nr:hypothetical protein CEXT_145131 [Caerostris extrusa]
MVPWMRRKTEVTDHHMRLVLWLGYSGFIVATLFVGVVCLDWSMKLYYLPLAGETGRTCFLIAPCDENRGKKAPPILSPSPDFAFFFDQRRRLPLTTYSKCHLCVS